MHAHEARLSDCDQWIEDAEKKYFAKLRIDEDEANYDYEMRSLYNKFRPLKGGPNFCEVDLRECTAERFDLRSRCFVFGM